jgi:putative transposase
VRERAARARELAVDHPKAVVARVMQVSRQSLYAQPRAETPPRALKVDHIDDAIASVARTHPTDGYRMVAALATRHLGRPVNRKRVLRVMRERNLIQPKPRLHRRRRPGMFVVTRPDQLWQLDMTSIWTAELGWCHLMAVIDCFTREIVSWRLAERGRTDEAIDVIAAGVIERGIEPGQLTLGTDNGSAFTARRFIAHLGELGITHRRGGYRDPESQAFIESWFGKLKEREVWLHDYETVDDAIAGVARYVDYYHRHPHSLVGYQTPVEVNRAWRVQQSAA